MTTAVQNIIKSVFRKPEDKLNILFFLNKRTERYLSLLSIMPHNFYLWTEEYNGSWTNKYRTKPSNVYHLPNRQALFDINLVFDVVISNSRFSQYDITKNISIGWHIPQIVVHHDDFHGMVIDDAGKEAFVDQARIPELIHRVGDVNIFDTTNIMTTWNTIGQVIYPGVDTIGFKYNENINDGILINPVDSYRFNPGIAYITMNKKHSEIKCSSSEEMLLNQYHNNSIFLNFETVGINPIVLEAMSCGMVVISLENRHLAEVITHGKNGYFANDEQGMKVLVDNIYGHKHVVEQIGKNARQTVVERFNIENFLYDWTNVLNLACTIIYTRQ
jgi:hypothetical protein